MVKYDLHPRGAWSLAIASLRLYLGQLPALGLAAALIVLPALLFLVPAESSAVYWGFAAYVLAAFLAVVVLVIRLTSHRIQGVRAAPRQILRCVRPGRLLRLLGVAGLTSLIFVLVLTPGTAFAVYTESQIVESEYVALLAYMLIIIPTVWVAVRLIFVLPAAVLEDAGPIRALNRSRILTGGSWWRISGSYLVWALSCYFLLVAVAAVGTLADLEVESVTVLTGTMAFLLAPVGLVFLVVLYYDVRVRREFFDVQDLS